MLKCFYIELQTNRNNYQAFNAQKPVFTTFWKHADQITIQYKHYFNISSFNRLQKNHHHLAIPIHTPQPMPQYHPSVLQYRHQSFS